MLAIKRWAWRKALAALDVASYYIGVLVPLYVWAFNRCEDAHAR